MIPVFLGIAAAVIAAVVLSVKAHNPKNEPPDEIIFSGEADEGEPCHDMLIGALSNMPQLSVCLEHNFYHIPAKLVPVNIDSIRYVAVYQSRRFFGSELAGVRYFAQVERATLLPRYKIAELPRQSEEMYVRFDVKEWQKKIKPISPTGKGIVAGYTEFAVFEVAEELPQLWLKSTEDVSLYAALKSAAAGDRARFKTLDVRKKGRSLLVTDDGKLIAICSLKAFEKAPVRTVNYVSKQIKEAKR